MQFFNTRAFRCLVGMLNDYDAHWGWGIDLVYGYECGVRIGIVDTVRVTKCRANGFRSYSYPLASAEQDAVVARYKSKRPGWRGPLWHPSTLGYLLG